MDHIASREMIERVWEMKRALMTVVCFLLAPSREYTPEGIRVLIILIIHSVISAIEIAINHHIIFAIILFL